MSTIPTCDNVESQPVEIEVRHPEDLALVRALIAGDRSSWLILFERHERTIYYAVLNTLRTFAAEITADLVEDLQADVVAELVRCDFRKLRRYEGRAKLDHWLKVVASNYTIDRLRKRRPTVSLSDDGEAASAVARTLVAPSPEPDRALEHRELAVALRALYDELSDEDRRFVDLFYLRELPFEDVALAMDTTVGAIYARKNRVRKRLIALADRRGFTS